jgi:hypothetical protein
MPSVPLAGRLRYYKRREAYATTHAGTPTVRSRRRRDAHATTHAEKRYVPALAATFMSRSRRKLSPATAFGDTCL